jgi:hypothetical protein
MCANAGPPSLPLLFSAAMFRELLGLPATPLNQFLGLVGGGLFFYFAVSGLS